MFCNCSLKFVFRAHWDVNVDCSPDDQVISWEAWAHELLNESIYVYAYWTLMSLSCNWLIAINIYLWWMWILSVPRMIRWSARRLTFKFVIGLCRISCQKVTYYVFMFCNCSLKVVFKVHWDVNVDCSPDDQVIS